jgi:acetate kinase
MRVLVVNAGSSSLKVSLVQDGERVREFNGLPDRPPQVDAVGHRIVHGGPDLVEPVLIDDQVEQKLRELTELAPLHQPASLAGVDQARRALPEVPHVACFDTAFHATIPAAASTYALPAQWRDRQVRRYGFHGLSHASASRRVAELVPAARRTVVCHLGSGASLCAVLEGRSVDTTMGFTPLEGLVMATRSGSVDPGLVLWLIQQRKVSPDDLADGLEHRAGLAGLAGEKDLQKLLARTDAEATLAVDVYLHRLAAGVAAMAASLGGLDTLVFTGGVGENAASIRERTASRLGFLGVRISLAANQGAVPDAEVTAEGAAVRTLVLKAREDLEVGHGVTLLLSKSHR